MNERPRREEVCILLFMTCQAVNTLAEFLHYLAVLSPHAHSQQLLPPLFNFRLPSGWHAGKGRTAQK